MATPIALASLLALLVAAPRAPQGRVLLVDSGGAAVERSPDELDAQPISRMEAVLARVEGFPAPEAPGATQADRAELRLVGGERLLGRVVGGSGDLLHVEIAGGEIAGGGELSLLVDRLRALAFPARVPGGRLAGLAPPEAGDRLYWKVPAGLDRVDGTLEAFAEDGVRFDARVLGVRTYPWAEVAALFVEPLSDEAPPAAALDGLQPVVVDLADGGRLRGALERLDGSGLTLRTARGETLRLPLPAIAQVAVDDGRVAFLSERVPSGVEEGSPFGDDLGMTWPHRMDLAVGGGPLRVGGRRWSRGIGVHAPSRLVFALDGGWRALRGAVGVDDQVLTLGARGSVRFRVHVDGELRWESDVLRGGGAAVELPPIDLQDARELALEVDMASDLHVADRADWLGMMLVR